MHVWFSTLVAALLSVVTRGFPWPRPPVLDPELAALRAAIEEQFPAAELHFDDDIAVLMLNHVVIGIPLQRLQWLSGARPERVPHAINHILADCRRCLLRQETPPVIDRTLVENRILPLVVPHLRVERSDEFRLVAYPLTPELDVTFHFTRQGAPQITVADANALGWSPEQLLAMARRTSTSNDPQVRLQRTDTTTTGWLEAHIDLQPASTIAIRTDLPLLVEGRHNSDMLIAFPTLETAWFLPNPTPESTARFVDRVVDAWASHPLSLTTQLYRLRMGRLTPWPANA
jgi:hypothetical protein